MLMSPSVRKNFSKKILDKIKDLDGKNQSYTQQIRNYADNLSDEEQDDYPKRSECLDSVTFYNNAIDEYSLLNSCEKITSGNERAWNYLTINNTITLNDYLPGYKEYAESYNLPLTISDIKGCWEIFRKYSKKKDRSSNVSYINPYDKEAKQDKEYAISDTSVDYDTYMLSGEEGELHDLNFKNLLANGVTQSNINSIKSIMCAKNNLNNYTVNGISPNDKGLSTSRGTVDYNVYGTWKCEFPTTNIYYFKDDYIGDPNKDFYMCYNSNDEIDFVFITKISWDRITIPTGDTTMQRDFVTINYISSSGSKCNLFKGSKEITEEVTTKVDGKDVTTTVKKTITIQDEYINFIASKLENCLRNLGELINKQKEKYIESEGKEKTNPNINYINLYNRLSKPTTELFDKINEYINTRFNIVNNYIFSDENMMSYLSSLRLRMDKKDGTLTGWYQNAGSVDASYLKLENNYKNNKSLFSSMAVWKVLDEPDEDSLVVDKEISIYYKKTTNKSPVLSVGDTVYIVDDKNAETSTKIKSIKAVRVSVESDLTVDGTITNEKDAYEIVFANQISGMYKTNNNLRLVKEIS